jgi:hypothetical protein
MFELDAAEKTTVLHRLKLGGRAATIPVIGFSVESIEFKGFNLNVWDLGDQNRI